MDHVQLFLCRLKIVQHFSSEPSRNNVKKRGFDFHLVFGFADKAFLKGDSHAFMNKASLALM